MKKTEENNTNPAPNQSKPEEIVNDDTYTLIVGSFITVGPSIHDP